MLHKIFFDVSGLSEKEIKIARKRKIVLLLLPETGLIFNFASELLTYFVMEYSKKYERHTPRCLECGDKISYGRHDKKFCCEDCKNRHHNHNARASRSFRRKVLSLLEKNYVILDGLVRAGTDAVWLDDAVLLGFTPAYATSFRKRGNRLEYSCFDISYELSPKRISSISKKSLTLQAGRECATGL